MFEVNQLINEMMDEANSETERKNNLSQNDNFLTLGPHENNH